MGNVTENKIIQFIQQINALKDKGERNNLFYIKTYMRDKSTKINVGTMWDLDSKELIIKIHFWDN